MKHLIPTLIAFMTVSLVMYGFLPSPGLVVIFAVSVCALGFTLWLQGTNEDEISKLQKQVNDINAKLGNVLIQLGWQSNG